MKRLLIYLVIMVFALQACGKAQEETHKTVQRPVIKNVKIETVKLEEIPELTMVTATVRSANTSLVSAKLMGTVSDIKVKTGQWVKKGDVLLTIYSPEIQARVSEAREALAQAQKGYEMAKRNLALMEKTYKRFSALYKEKAISEQEFDEIQTKYDVARLQLKKAEAALSMAKARVKEAEAYNAYTVIKSPVDGRVAEKKIDIGSMTLPGTPLFVIEEPRYRVEVPVDESLMDKIKPGMKLKVRIDAINIITEGIVEEISHQVDPVTRTFTVKLGLKGIKGLMGGQFARVIIPKGTKKLILVPEKAIVKRGQLTGVYVVDSNGIVTLRFIRTGKTVDSKVEVLSGLDPDERIVVDGVENVQDGGIIKG
ncbi:MAG: efflux RND transporter periplasmic adaptor subunit [Nitrospirae bacterium]|nr:efflux RND transporter periplasmic adaptor subunit [Nitrospirota bacterium]